METIESNARETAERLTAAAAEAKSEASRAAEALTAAELVVATVTAKIVAHDGSSPGIEKLAAERGIAVARVEALTARLSDKMTALSAAQAEAAKAGKDLDKSELAAGLAEVDASSAAFDEKLRVAAVEVATAYIGHVDIHSRVMRLNARVQMSGGTRPEDVQWSRPLRDALDLGEVFGSQLQAAIASASRR
jgi:hypothetical protein